MAPPNGPRCANWRGSAERGGRPAHPPSLWRIVIVIDDRDSHHDLVRDREHRRERRFGAEHRARTASPRESTAPTAAQCHVSSAAERAAAPFGQTSLPLFTCELTVSGKRARYAVQVLQNGCFVAERLGGGQSVQGCGVKRS